MNKVKRNVFLYILLLFLTKMVRKSLIGGDRERTVTKTVERRPKNTLLKKETLKKILTLTVLTNKTSFSRTRIHLLMIGIGVPLSFLIGITTLNTPCSSTASWLLQELCKVGGSITSSQRGRAK
jgi:hypothetical protein